MSLEDHELRGYAERLARSMIGHRLSWAVNGVGAHGTSLRVTRDDNTNYPVTMDWAPSRINVQVDGGTITAAHVG